MDKKELIKVLSEIEIFRNLNNEELEKVAALAEVKTYPPSAIVFYQKSEADSFYIILKGEVRIFREKEDGERQLMGILEKGEIIGEKMLFIGAAHANTVITGRETTMLLEITKKDFHELNELKLDTESVGTKFSNIIIEALADRLFHADNKIVTLKEVGRIISEETSLKGLTERTLLIVLDMVPSEKAFIETFNRYSGRMEIQTSFGYNSKIKSFFFPRENGLVGEAIKQGKVTTNKDLNLQKIRKFGYETKRFLIAPITVENQVFGVIYLGNKTEEREFSNNNRVLLKLIADILGPAIERLMLKKSGKAEEELKRKYIEF